ncbi:MAG: hypothetical protein OEY49_14955, partial [Candidatus Heimdallarchaeota archaeon]|nr:hypothetical protein [Candidatus Heimdallarchaeota archaeon]
ILQLHQPYIHHSQYATVSRIISDILMNKEREVHLKKYYRLTASIQITNEFCNYINLTFTIHNTRLSVELSVIF